eukprot:451966_1
MADMNKWHQNTKKRLQEETKIRVAQRIKQLESVIQYKFSIAYKMPFKIQETFKHQMHEQILKAIKNRNIPNNCRSERDCYDKTRVWWHRDKSKHLGPYLFSPIIFELLLKTVMQAEHMEFEPNIKQRIIFFIDTFICILDQNIKFPLSGAKPLINDHIFLESNNNKFKDNCVKFIKYFGNGIQWEGSSKKTKIIQTNNGSKTEYQKDKNRANNAKQSFIDLLGKIKVKIATQSEEIIYQQVQNWFGITRYSERSSNINNIICNTNSNQFNPETNPAATFPTPMTVSIPPPIMPIIPETHVMTPMVTTMHGCNNCNCYYYSPIHQQSQQYRATNYYPYHPYAYQRPQPIRYNPYSYSNSHGQRMQMQRVLPVTHSYQSTHQINNSENIINNQSFQHDNRSISNSSMINSNSPISITAYTNHDNIQFNNTQMNRDNNNYDSNLIGDCDWMLDNNESYMMPLFDMEENNNNNNIYI